MTDRIEGASPTIGRGNIDRTEKREHERIRKMRRDKTVLDNRILASTPCPTCGVRKNEYCRSASGFMLEHHKARYKAENRAGPRHVS